MRKDTILGITYGVAVTLPFIFSGCRNQEAAPNPTATVHTERDFSKYIPLVVSVRPSRDICTDDSNEITYLTGDHVKLFDLSTSDIIDFQISVENEEALFAREGSPYIGTVREGELFGVLNDPKGRGARAIAKLVKVNPDSIKIAPITDCKNIPLA